MGVRRIAQLAALIGAFVLLGAAPALANEALTPSGELVYTWHGDPARGCAAVGVCGVQGALIIRPDSDVEYFTQGGEGAELDFGDATATVRVRRTDPGSSGTCVDGDTSGGGFFSTLFLRFGQHGRVSTKLADQVSSGRCAGPLAEDLGRLVLHGMATRGKHLRFVFHQSLPYAAGPYRGMFSSNLTLVPDLHPDPGFSSTSESSSSSGSTRPRFALMERVTLRYHVAVGATTVTIPFRGEGDAFCAALDSCGVTGSLALGLRSAGATLTLTAQRRVAHRVGRGRTLADFRSGKLGLLLSFPVAMQHATLSESLQRSGGPVCRDARGLGAVAQTWFGAPFGQSPFVGIHGPSLPILLTAQSTDDLLRTYCPGPSQADVFNSNVVLARGSISRRELLMAHSTVDVTARGGFAGPGYTGSSDGSLALALSLLKMTVATVRVRVP